MARTPRAAARLAAWPAIAVGLLFVGSGVLYLLDRDPYGWFGVGCGALVIALGVIGLVRSDWALALFGGMLVLATTTLMAGVASGSDLYIVAGVAALLGVALGAALVHQMARLAEADSRAEPRER